ncbi:unnamed protein product [Notodromas monacha]|uniref:F-box domain-containing protein n=1 Tax=Notodromas monacha TaxID=399045 RepID=A0A7R9G9V2_9CRUS|nr:unnamed protein product [Notodromas monacha]CAG0914677.1 unnamed protein product [Notodromas monacha]
MRAFLVKLNFGLQDLSYIELGKCGSVQGGVHHDQGGVQKRRTTEVCMEWFDADEFEYQLTCIPMHVHKLEDGVKLGSPCSRQHCLVKIFSIGEVQGSAGAFVMQPNEKFNFSKVEVRINREVFLSYCNKKSVRRLKHGDIIEFFLRDIPYFKVMFLSTDECLGRVPQTSVLLSCPWPILQNIFQFLNPFETMESIVPVCRQFFQLMRSGAIWTHLKFEAVFDKTYVPYGHVDSFAAFMGNEEFLVKLETLEVTRLTSYRLLRNEKIIFPNVREVTLWCSSQNDFSVDLKRVFPRLKLHSIFWKRSLKRRASVWSGGITKLLDFFGSGVLQSLHFEALPEKFSEDDWLLAQRRGTFTDLKSLTLLGGDFQKMPDIGMMSDVFPKLKSIWFQDVQVSPRNVIDHILEMPSVEKLWFRNVRSEFGPEPIPLYFFDRRPKKWLENIKLISADLWEVYIPYSRMINLECVALFFRGNPMTGLTDTGIDESIPRSLENMFKELRKCSKLKGLILRVPNNCFRCSVFQGLSQKLEFAAVSGAKLDEVKSVLECLSMNQTHLEEVWIRVFSSSAYKLKDDIMDVLMTFKSLKNVVFVYTPRLSHEMDWEQDDYEIDSECFMNWEIDLRRFADEGCHWKQVTFLFDGPSDKESFTFNIQLRKTEDFSSYAVNKFFSDRFKYAPDEKRRYKFKAVDLILTLFPKLIE